MKLFIMYSSPVHSYLVPLRPKLSSSHPILEHPQPVFLPQCDRPRVTTIQNNGQQYLTDD
jgi:hypothetical protein